MRIVEESVVAKRGMVEHLLEMHADELATHRHIMTVSPDWAKYEAMEQANMVMGLFAYDDAVGRLAGYSVTFVCNHLHYSDLLYAQNDVLYVHPHYRKSRVGLDLIARTEDLARARGVRFMLWHAKPDTALDKLLPRLGYDVQDVIYSKEI